MFQKIAAVGITIGVTGWCIGVFLEQRLLGVTIFLVGFVIGVIGTIGGHLNMDFTESKLQISGLGLKLGSMGFGVACLSMLSRFFIASEDIANYIFYVGIAIVIVGISILILGIKKS